jgi:hypothetical protein
MSEWFDRLAKAAAGGSSRRDALKYLGGLVAGGFLAVLPGRAWADNGGGVNENDADRCQKYCKPCVGLKGGVHGHCISHCMQALHKNPKAVLCGKCSAKAPVTICQGKTPNCCGNGTCCAATCCASVCCASGLTCCSGKCVNLQTDSSNCGKCGTKCASGKTCKSGTCS